VHKGDRLGGGDVLENDDGQVERLEIAHAAPIVLVLRLFDQMCTGANARHSKFWYCADVHIGIIALPRIGRIHDLANPRQANRLSLSKIAETDAHRVNAFINRQ